MAIRVGINGFGRMGRLGLRAGWAYAGLEFSQINEIACDAAGSAHLLKFDSVHGTWPVACGGAGDAMRVADHAIAYSGQATIAGTDWSDCDIVIEAPGRHHKTPGALQDYFAQGVRKVIVAAPTDGAPSPDVRPAREAAGRHRLGAVDRRSRCGGGRRDRSRPGGKPPAGPFYLAD